MVLVSDKHVWHTGFVLWTLLLCLICRFVGTSKVTVRDQIFLCFELISRRSVCAHRIEQPVQRAPNRHAGAIHHGIRRATRRGGIFFGRDAGRGPRRTAAALHHGHTCRDSVHRVYTGELCNWRDVRVKQVAADYYQGFF
jgi:hypothetical protein